MSETYQESGSASVYALLVNWVWNYTTGRFAPFFLFGSGFGVANMSYKDVYSDGTFSSYSISPSAVSFNAGLGFTFPGGFEIRAVVPAFITLTSSVSILPVLLIMGGYHFSF